MLDTVGVAHMLQGTGTLFTTDRFGVINSALNLNGGFTYVPAGIYFYSPQFTISSWVYPLQVGTWSRLIDFGNGYPSNNIIITLDQGLNQKPVFELIQGTTTSVGFPISSVSLVSNQWQLLTCTYDGTTQNIYINGVLTANVLLTFTMPSISRANNYIGKSSYGLDGNSFSYIDELRFSNVSLSASQVNDMFLSDGQYKSITNNLYAFLTHYWPITSTQMLADIVGCADMIQGTLTPVIYAADRFGNPNSAINLNNGFTQVPSGVFFDTPQFSISLWVLPQSLSANTKVFEFANAWHVDEINIGLVQLGQMQPGFGIYTGSISTVSLSSTINIVPGQWQFLVVTYDGSMFKIYINAVLTGSVPLIYNMPYIVRTSNFFGKSNNPGNGFSQSILDDIRFYNISLTQMQINDLLNAIDASSTINSCATTTTTTTTSTTQSLPSSSDSTTSKKSILKIL